MSGAEISSSSTLSSFADIGLALRKGRAVKDLSIDDVARELHLQVRQITALESGDFSNFRTPAFVKGYLRACAKYYGLDGDLLVSAYELALPQPKSYFPIAINESSRVILLSDRRYKRLRIALLSICAIVVAAGLLWFGLRSMGIPGSGAVDIERPLLDSTTEQQDVSESLTVIESSPLPSAGLDQLSGDAQSSNQSVMTPQPESRESSLHMEFSDDCWVQLKADDGKVLHEKVHKKGDVFDMTVPVPLRVRIGRAESVNVSYNGAAVKVSTKAGFQSAQFVLGEDLHSGEIE